MNKPSRQGWDRDRLFIFYPITSELQVWDTDVNRCCDFNKSATLYLIKTCFDNPMNFCLGIPYWQYELMCYKNSGSD